MAKSKDKEWSGQSRGGRSGYLFFVYTIRLFGVRVAYAVLAVVALHFVLFAPRATRAIWRYNRRRLHHSLLRSAVEVYRHFFVFGQTIIDRMALRAGMQDRYRFEFDNYDRFLEIINGEQGVVMIGAHMGCWQAGVSFFGKYGRKINVVMFDVEHEQIKRVLEQSDQAADFKVIPVNQGSLEAMLQIKIALNDGEYVCFNGDRYIDRATSMPHEFMGSRAYFPAGPFKIASRCRVPVVFYYAMRESGRTYRFIFHEVKVEGRPTAEWLLEKYVASLEQMVRKYPRQWFNFYDFWENDKE